MAKKQTISPVYKKYASRVIKSIMTDDFYQYFMDVVSAGKNKFQFSNRRIEKTVDETWVVAIENTIKPFEEIINNPRNFIKRDEIIVNIALAKKVTPESIRHLASHGDMVDTFDTLKSEIRPNRLQETVKEDSWDTYENKFVYTLLEMTWEFVDKRYEAIFAALNEEFGAYLKMEGESHSYQEGFKYNVDLRIQQEDDLLASDDKNMNIFSRIARIHRIIGAFRNSTFAKEMKKYAKVKPPLVPTNAIKKNPNFKACHKLWNFILAYNDIGYKIEIYEQSNEVNEDFALDIYNSVFFNYIILKNHLEREEDREIDTSRQFKKKALKPRYIKEIVEEIVKNYDINDVEIRKVLIEEMTKADLMKEEEEERRRLVEEKEREMEAKRKKEEKEAKERAKAEEAERKRLEKERIAEEKRIEKERIAEEKRIQKEKEQAEAEELSKAKHYEALIRQMAADRDKVLARRLEAIRQAEKLAAELAEKKRKEAEAEAKRIALEKKKAEEEARLKAEAEAEKKRLAEEAAAEKLRIAAEKKAEKERIAAEKQAEKERIAAEKQAEKERIAAEKQAEKERIAAEKQAEKERIAAEKQAEKERAEAEKIRAAEQKAAEKAKAIEEKAAAKAAVESEKAENKAKAAAEKAAAKAAENAEKQRLKAEADAAKKLEKERIAKEKADAKAAAEAEKAAEKARIAKEKAEEKKEAEKLRRKLAAQAKKAKEKDKASAQKAKEKEKAKAAAEKQKQKDKEAAEKQKLKEKEAAEKKKQKEKEAAEKKKQKQKEAEAKRKAKEAEKAAKEKEKAAQKAAGESQQNPDTEKKQKLIKTDNEIIEKVEDDILSGKINTVTAVTTPVNELYSKNVNDDANYAYGKSNIDASELTKDDEKIARKAAASPKRYEVDLSSVSAPTFTSRPVEDRKEIHRSARPEQVSSPFLKEVLENSLRNPMDEETIKKISEEIENNTVLHQDTSENSNSASVGDSESEGTNDASDANQGFFRNLFRRR